MLGMPQCRDSSYAVASALSYWAFVCRDRKKTPSKGYETWTYLGKAIKQSSLSAIALETYLQGLCNKLSAPSLRPAVLTKIVNPEQILMRVPIIDGIAQVQEMQELKQDQAIALLGWRDLLSIAEKDGFGERRILQLCKTEPNIIEAICRLKHSQLFGEKPNEMQENQFIEVEATNA